MVLVPYAGSGDIDIDFYGRRLWRRDVRRRKVRASIVLCIILTRTRFDLLVDAWERFYMKHFLMAIICDSEYRRWNGSPEPGCIRRRGIPF